MGYRSWMFRCHFLLIVTRIWGRWTHFEEHIFQRVGSTINWFRNAFFMPKIDPAGQGCFPPQKYHPRRVRLRLLQWAAGKDFAALSKGAGFGSGHSTWCGEEVLGYDFCGLCRFLFRARCVDQNSFCCGVWAFNRGSTNGMSQHRNSWSYFLRKTPEKQQTLRAPFRIWNSPPFWFKLGFS